MKLLFPFTIVQSGKPNLKLLSRNLLNVSKKEISKYVQPQNGKKSNKKDLNKTKLDNFLKNDFIPRAHTHEN